MRSATIIITAPTVVMCGYNKKRFFMNFPARDDKARVVALILAKLKELESRCSGLGVSCRVWITRAFDFFKTLTPKLSTN